MEKKRGRPSVASLTVVPLVPRMKPKLPPPDSLTLAQKVKWRAAVDSLGPEWFPAETRPMLEGFCRHAAAADHIARLIADVLKAEPMDVPRYDKLLRMQERETRALASLATRLRMTPQSLRTARARKPDQGPRPWNE